ncbi:MAG: hypothetical protein ACTSYL_04655 [Candidatus Thorarchaeota archaeon]
MSYFYPISPLVGIIHTSYAAQAGVMDEKWAVRVVRGKKILAEKTINDLDLENLVGVIYGHARIEGLSRHAVAMCAGRLMQFARRYQESGVCPDFEVPDLVRSDGTRVGGEAVETTTATDTDQIAPVSNPVEETTESSSDVAPIGYVPKLQPLGGKALWSSAARARAHLLLNMAIYGGQLPEGHLDAMFNGLIDELIHEWSANNNAEEIVRGFASIIQSCSDENQVPVTTEGASIETGSCIIMTVANEIDPTRQRILKGYPCAFHEALAKRVSEITGVKIHINASSTGCRVTFNVDA